MCDLPKEEDGRTFEKRGTADGFMNGIVMCAFSAAFGDGNAIRQGNGVDQTKASLSLC